jgi:hypothetical protein
MLRRKRQLIDIASDMKLNRSVFCGLRGRFELTHGFHKWSNLDLSSFRGVSSMKPSTAIPAPAPDELGGPALRAFFAIAAAWDLRPAEARRLLGDPPESTYYKWKKHQDGAPGRDVIERISHVLGIFKALQLLFPDPTRADAWLRRPNTATPFGGRPALERMLSGNVADLYVVRRYLDAQRG